jgi:hypothetical protein
MAKKKVNGRRRAEADAAAPAVRWFGVQGSGSVMLALLTDEGPAAYWLSPSSAIFLAEALRQSAGASRMSERTLDAGNSATGGEAGAAAVASSLSG